jgi:hypothetical protein
VPHDDSYYTESRKHQRSIAAHAGDDTRAVLTYETRRKASETIVRTGARECLIPCVISQWVGGGRVLLRRHRVHGGAGGAGEGLGRGLQQEGVDGVGGTIVGEGFEVPVLALGEPDVAEVEEVHGQE